MKKLLLFVAIALSINVFGQSTVKIGNLPNLEDDGDFEVMTKDLGRMNWDEAVKACADLGDGWRLPTIEELNILYENKDKIGGFAYSYYWSSTERSSCWSFDGNGVWRQDFNRGYRGDDTKSYSNYVRAVRGTMNLEKKEVISVKIGNLEVMTEDLGKLNWDEAKKACADLGDRWRLPTKDELNILYENKDKIGGFSSYVYWSSTEGDNVGVWRQSFMAGDLHNGSKCANLYVRAVRAF